MDQQAFVLRIVPSGIDRVSEALAADQIMIGWSEAEGLLDPSLAWEQFREIVRRTYFEEDTELRRAGGAAGHLWRFLRDMNVGDLVVVPHGSEFYVSEVKGGPTHDPARSDEDTSYRRNVIWLNEKKPIPRALARSALISRMKTQSTCADATDLLAEIKDCLAISTSGRMPTFQGDLQSRLIRETLDEMRIGRIEDYGFERLIRDVLIGLGAEDARIVPRNLDKGADIIASFRVAGAFQQIVAVQAKHWQPEPPVGKE